MLPVIQPHHLLTLLAVFSIALTIELPPRVARPPTIVPDSTLEDIVYFDSEGELGTELPCQALGNDPIKYSWTKAGVLLDVNDPKYISNKTKISKIVLKNEKKGTIILTELKEDDGGLYQCKAENSYGTSLSKKIILKKATKRSWGEVTERTYKPMPGTFLRLDCNAPPNDPPAQMRWLKFSGMGETQQNLVVNQRISQDLDGNLYFANVQKIDENFGEQYACEASLKKLIGIKIEGAYSTIKVLPGDATQQFPTELQYNSPTSVIALKGERTRFKCIFSGNPTPEIEWRRIRGGKLDATRMQGVNQNFLLYDVKYEDKGMYECRGHNGVPPGQPPITKRFKLEVEDDRLPSPNKPLAKEVTRCRPVTFIPRHMAPKPKPSWEAEPMSVEAGVEESAVFECSAAGKPTPKIEWFINGVPIAKVKADSRRILSDGQLRFVSLNQDDAQVIQCNASNKHGYLWADVSLSILAYKPEIKIPFKYKKVAEGQTVVLPCDTDGKPNPRIYWKRGDQTMEGQRYQQHKSGNLTIINAMVEDEGFWTCYTENRYGKADVTGELVVREKTRIKIAPSPKVLTVRHDKKTVFTCSATTDQEELSKLTYTWLHDGVPVDLTDKRFSLTEGKGLIIDGTTAQDTGEYTCLASNGLDSDRASAQLKVLAPPDRPTDVNFDSCLSRSVIVTWVPGSDNFSPITKYFVEYNHTYVPHKWHRAATVTDMKNLQAKVVLSPYANYTFRVIAVNQYGESKPSKHSTATCFSNPEKPDYHPRDVHTDRSKPGVLIVKWKRMEQIDHNGEGFHYVLTIKKDGKSQDHVISNWTQTSKEFDYGLIFEPYEIYVSAKNSEGMPIYGATLHIGYTGEAEPRTAPDNLELVPGSEPTDKTVQLQWDPVDLSPDMIRGVFQGYRIRYWKVGQEDTTSKIIEVHRKAPLDTRVKRVAPGNGKEVHEAKNLPPFSDLEFEVIARNTFFESNASNVCNATTLEGAPGPVKSARVIMRGSFHLLLEWEQPRHINGILRGYDIGYQKIDGLRLLPMTDDRITTFDDPDLSRAFMDKLQFDTEYRITVWARTTVGRGDPYSFDAKTANSGGNLQKPTIVVANIAADFINVTWSVPQNSDTPAGAYHFVRFKKLGDMGEWSTTEKDNMNSWANVSDLEPRTKYEVCVVAESADGKLQTQSALELVTTVGDAEPSVNQDTSIAQASWFIAMMVLIAILVLFLIIVCFIKRSRGEKYNVQEREKFGGADPENPDKDLFNEYPKSGETEPLAAGSPDSFDNEPDKLPGGSETDSMAEYGDVDPSKFNEDGSFIGQYGTGKPEEKGNQPSAMSTFV